jgi:hypothetical protein
MNRNQRRAAEAIARKMPPKPTQAAPQSQVVTTNHSGPYYHVAIQDGEKSKDEKNLSAEAVLDRVAVPHQLNKRFRVDGFEFQPARIKRLRITKTDAVFDMAGLVRTMDMSSLSAAFQGFAALGQKMNDGEDVTDDILKQADQIIQTKGLVREQLAAFDVTIIPDKVFVAMSFAPELVESFESISEVCGEEKKKVIRADKEISSAPVMDRIIIHLKESSYVIADLTKARPNVYYEIGYFDAICAARRVDPARHLLLVADNIDDDAHFDLKHRGIQEYKNPYALRKIVKAWFQALRGGGPLEPDLSVEVTAGGRTVRGTYA